MDKHATLLKNLCRLCGNSTCPEQGVAKKTAFKRELLQKFIIDIENIPFMDKELAMVCAQKLAETFHPILLEKDNIDSSVSSLSDRDKISIIQSIFSMEKENI